MRLVLLAAVVVLGLVSWQVVGVFSAKARVTRAATGLVAAPDIEDAQMFAQRLSADLLEQGITVDDLVVTLSATEPYALDDERGTARAVSARLTGRKRILFGVWSLPVSALVQVRGAVPDGPTHQRSQWPAESQPLALKQLIPKDAPAPVENEPTITPGTWTSSSRDGAVTVSSSETSTGCSVRCEARGEVVWTESSPCRVTRQHLRFVSDDCERVIAFDAAAFGSKSWQTRPVAVVLTRSRLAFEVSAVTVIRDVEVVRRRHGWLRGFSDVEGEGPQWRADGSAVVFTTVEGQQHEISSKR